MGVGVGGDLSAGCGEGRGPPAAVSTRLRVIPRGSLATATSLPESIMPVRARAAPRRPALHLMTNNTPVRNFAFAVDLTVEIYV